MTNTEFLTDFMEYNRGGALGQVMVLEAISKYADEVVSTETQPDNWPAMISWDAWRAACIDYQERYRQK